MRAHLLWFWHQTSRRSAKFYANDSSTTWRYPQIPRIKHTVCPQMWYHVLSSIYLSYRYTAQCRQDPDCGGPLIFGICRDGSYVVSKSIRQNYEGLSQTECWVLGSETFWDHTVSGLENPTPILKFLEALCFRRYSVVVRRNYAVIESKYNERPIPSTMARQHDASPKLEIGIKYITCHKVVLWSQRLGAPILTSQVW